MSTKLHLVKELILRPTRLNFQISQSAWMLRIDELAYLMHELSLLCNLRQGFDEKFLEVSRNEYKDKMMDRFVESNLTLRSMVMFKKEKIKLSS